ncbi:MAG TPA: hypothetical protein VL651_01600, partial [Bacteroidia bacterium]|nr:hypothetical protein [Bacteroidia bacterium]
MKKASPGLFLALLVSLFAQQLFAANVTSAARISLREHRLFRKAEMHYLNAEFDDAIPLYVKLLSEHPDDPKFNFELGLCYYYSSTSRPLSLGHFLAACKFSGKDTLADLIFHTGLAYLSLNRFDEAETLFKQFKSDKQNELRGMSIDEMIAQCETGKKFWAVPSRTRIVNLGSNINSIYPDYAAIVTRDHSKLIFTSKRAGTTGGKKDGEGFYYEDVYMSRANAGWSNSQRIDTGFQQPKFYDLKLWFGQAQNISEINTTRHDGSVALSPDEKSLYIFRTDDVWRSELVNDEWKNPVRLNQNIDNSKTYEPSVFITHDGNNLYFVSDRKGGTGGKDIWMSGKTSSGDWGVPTNLGSVINTVYDEESPYVTDDGNTLYFSSQGHTGMGGYDVFRSKKDVNGNWMEPENLGAPVNNGDDDVFYYPD